jgi:hypothetical protein
LSKHPGGAPPIYTKEKLAKMKKQIEAYTEKADIPILAECATEMDVLRQRLYEYPELSDAIKKLIQKKESQLEKLASFNVINTSMAIFSLKQIGWRDKQEHEITGKDGEPIEIKWQ